MITLNTILFIFAIIFIHWIADFVLQTHEQAVNKSTDNWYLTKHVLTYTGMWMVFITIFLGFSNEYVFDNSVLWFLLITFVSHWITDYYTSRLNSYLWKKGDVHNFFVSVGFDQVLHYVQLFLTIYILL